MQRRFALIVFGVDIDSRFEQDLSRRRGIHIRCIVQRRFALIVFGVGVGSYLEQGLSRRRGIIQRRIVQRRIAHIVFGVGSRFGQNLGRRGSVTPQGLGHRRGIHIHMLSNV